jgi:hypothetical protein
LGGQPPRYSSTASRAVDVEWMFRVELDHIHAMKNSDVFATSSESPESCIDKPNDGLRRVREA